MAINYEFERNIRNAFKDGNKDGVRLLRAQQQVFHSLVDTGLVQDLPREEDSESDMQVIVTEDSTNLPRIIKDLRGLSSQSQEDLAHETSLHLNTIKSIERVEESNPRLKTLSTVLSALGATIQIRFPRRE